MEAYSSFRHDLNMYIAVAFSGVYTSNKASTNVNLPSLLYGALKKVILLHPSLALVIHGQSSDNPTFNLLSQVDLKKLVVWLEDTTEEQAFELLKQYMGKQFENIDEIPPWRLLVCARENQLSVTFLFHHALGDGTSGTIFMKELGKALNDSSPLENGLVDIPKSTEIRPSLESVLDMPQGFFNILKIVAKDMGIIKGPQNPWTGAPVPDTYSSGNGPAKTNIARYSISAENMKKLLTESRSHGTTIAALLTAIGVVSLNSVISDDSYQTILSSIPRNLRPLIDAVSENDMGTYVASIDSAFDRSSLKTENDNVSDTIWGVSGQLTSSIQAAIKKKNSELNSGLLKYAGNMRQFFTKKVGKPRSCSLEMSSLVVDKKDDSPSDEWTLDNLYFYQCANSVGAPLGFSAISYRGGALNITCAWASDIVADELVSQLMDRFDQNVNQLISSTHI